MSLDKDHIDYLRRLIHKRVWDTSEHEDIVAETLLRFVTSKPNGKASIKTWLGTLARQVIIDRWRHSKRLSAIPETTAFAEEPPVEWDPSARLEVEEVMDALQHVDPLNAQMFMQHYAEGISSTELSKMHNLPAESIKQRIQRVRHAVGKRLTGPANCG